MLRNWADILLAFERRHGSLWQFDGGYDEPTNFEGLLQHLHDQGILKVDLDALEREGHEENIRQGQCRAEERLAYLKGALKRPAKRWMLSYIAPRPEGLPTAMFGEIRQRVMTPTERAAEKKRMKRDIADLEAR